MIVELSPVIFLIQQGSENINRLLFNSRINSLLLCFLIFTLTGCNANTSIDKNSNIVDSNMDTRSNTNLSSSTDDDSLIATLEGDNQSQVSYLFYNEADSEKNIVLSFHANYIEKNIIKSELLQDDTIVTMKVKTRDTSIHDHGQFIISLPDFVERFNKIRLFDNHGVIFTLETGQYYLEKTTVKNPIKGNEWYLTSYTTNENINTFNMKADFNKKGNDSYQYQILLPKKLDEQNILKQQDNSSIINNTLKIDYESKIELGDFKGYTNIDYDLLVVQKDTTGQKFTLMSANVPLSIKQELIKK
ncbi:hypothetical protein GZH47_13760 [Paenibacillus rhizovicinus]|uniref:Uncharacterized protein n=1 Tax=Paenibacillus rhizovicinus TaxID=2704463 RepID=A0A6C0P002_9BACL|nr:hypothetical protein [Paenibacillus rhizovicinus]QHW31798.1 hypothetical protein GZH47_13760 [Paenibacillus rhizovicinus]